MCAQYCMCMHFILYLGMQFTSVRTTLTIKEWRNSNADRSEKQATRKKVCLALHISVNSQKWFVKRCINVDEAGRESVPPSEAITQLYLGIRRSDKGTQCHPCL